MTQAIPTTEMQADQYRVLGPNLLRLARKSRRTGVVHYMDLPITQEQLLQYARGGALIQNVFPHCTPDQREFIQSGYTPEDWAAIFPEGDQE